MPDAAIVSHDRVAVVTGVAQGIGRAVCRRLLAEGITVVGVDRDAAGLERATKEFPRLVPLAGDIADWETHEAAADLAQTRGRLGYWVNNAAIDAVGGAHEVTPDELRTALDVLQFGPMFGCAVAVRRMLGEGGGAIVNVSSIQGIAAFPRYYAYQAAKAALIMISRGIAVDYGARGIRCNAVLPGVVDTAMTRMTLSDAPDINAALSNEGRLSPMGRVGTDREIAEAVWFLLSPAATYVSGTGLVVDGAASARCFDYSQTAVE